MKRFIACFFSGAIAITSPSISSLSAFGTPVLASTVERGVMSYEEIISPQYDNGRTFSGGLAAVEKDGKWGYINSSNEVEIPFVYDYAGSFSGGLAVVFEFTNESMVKVGFIDKDQNYTYLIDISSRTLELAKSKDDNFSFQGGIVTIPLGDYDGNYFGYISFCDKGEVILSDTTSVQLVGQGVLMGFSRQHYYLDNTMYDMTTGEYKSLFPINRDLLKYFEEGIESSYMGSLHNMDTITKVLSPNQDLFPAWAYDINTGKEELGFIDFNTHKWVIEPAYTRYFYSTASDGLILFGDTGLAMLGKDDKVGAIDKNGNVVIPFIYEEVWPYRGGLSKFKLDGKYGFMDDKQNIVIEPQYDDVTAFSSTLGVSIAVKGNDAFMIDRENNIIEGSDKVDTSAYFRTGSDGGALYSVPEEIVVVTSNNKVGYAEINYIPKLPSESDMSSWSFDEVIKAIENELVPVSLQNMYQSNILRKDFATIVMQTLNVATGMTSEELVKEKTGKDLSTLSSPFNDTSSSDVIAANALGIISGRSNSKFSPYDEITHAEAALLLTNAAKVLGQNVVDVPNSQVSDASSFLDWFADAVDYVNSTNIMTTTGNGEFDPYASYTREQSFVTINRLFEEVE